MQGTIAGIALKVAHGAPLVAVEEATVTLDGIGGNVRQSKRRQITFLSEELWYAAQQELGAALPWPLRRANILTRGLVLSELIGRQLRIGDVLVQINGETTPCEVMDHLHDGLRIALVPECRGGVYGSVIQGGRIRVGDGIKVETEQRTAAGA